MIELSEKMSAALGELKERGVDSALEDIKHVNELKNSKHFRWFVDLVAEEIRKMENRILIPRLVKDEEMPRERLKLIEWRRFSNLLYKKEQEVRSLLEKEYARREV